MSDQRPGTKRPQRTGAQEYLHYSAIGLQMAGVVLAGAWGGRSLDKWLGLRFPVFTLTLSLLAIVGAMVMLFKATGPRGK